MDIRVMGATEAGLSHALTAYRKDPGVYRFITKRFPDIREEDYYFPREYRSIYKREIEKLKSFIREHPEDRFIIGELGNCQSAPSGIFEAVIKPSIKKDLKEFTNVKFTWK